jgi:hypothetical protein
MAREGNLEAPTRHPLDWQERRVLERRAGLQGDGAHLRHLPRLPPLREPVRIVPHAVRPGRRRARPWKWMAWTKGLLEGGRPVLPVRPVLPDQVPLCAAARVEPGLPAHHAARQGHQVQEGRSRLRRKIAGLHRRARPVCRHSHRGAGGQCGQQDQARAQRHGEGAGCGQERLAARAGHAKVPLRRLPSPSPMR